MKDKLPVLSLPPPELPGSHCRYHSDRSVESIYLASVSEGCSRFFQHRRYRPSPYPSPYLCHVPAPDNPLDSQRVEQPSPHAHPKQTPSRIRTPGKAENAGFCWTSRLHLLRRYSRPDNERIGWIPTSPYPPSSTPRLFHASNRHRCNCLISPCTRNHQLIQTAAYFPPVSEPDTCTCNLKCDRCMCSPGWDFCAPPEGRHEC